MNEIQVLDKMLISEIFTNLYRTKVLFEFIEIIDDSAKSYTTTLGFVNHGKKYQLSISVNQNATNNISYDFKEVSSFKMPSPNKINVINKILDSEISLTKDKKDVLTEILKLSSSDNIIVNDNDIIFDNFIFLVNPRTINKRFYVGYYDKFKELRITEKEYIETFIDK